MEGEGCGHTQLFFSLSLSLSLCLSLYLSLCFLLISQKHAFDCKLAVKTTTSSVTPTHTRTHSTQPPLVTSGTRSGVVFFARTLEFHTKKWKKEKLRNHTTNKQKHTQEQEVEETNCKTQKKEAVEPDSHTHTRWLGLQGWVGLEPERLKGKGGKRWGKLMCLTTTSSKANTRGVT